VSDSIIADQRCVLEALMTFGHLCAVSREGVSADARSEEVTSVTKNRRILAANCFFTVVHNQ
jgi:hypothetical protein